MLARYLRFARSWGDGEPAHDAAWKGCGARRSRDGKRIYFGSSRSGQYQIWKIAVSHGRAGPVVQITKRGGYGGMESYDGKTFYYGKAEQAGDIWSVPVDGGPEVLLPVPLRYQQRPENFTAGRTGLYLGLRNRQRRAHCQTARNPRDRPEPGAR